MNNDQSRRQRQDMTRNQKQQVSFRLSDRYGIGNLETPNWPRATEFIHNLGEYYVLATQDTIGTCMDGRPGSSLAAVPNGAGGALLYAIADYLASDDERAAHETIARSISSAYRSGGSLRVHRDTHAQGREAGCAAADKIGLVFDIIAKRSKDVQDLIGKLGLGGYVIDEQTHQQIVARAQSGGGLLQASGDQLVTYADDCLASFGSSGSYTDILQGSHCEAAAIMNRRHGTTLNRNALAQDFDVAGEQYQAFNIDVWSFKPSAQALYPEDVSMQQRVAMAMLYYNVAAIMALCGAGMTAVIVE